MVENDRSCPDDRPSRDCFPSRAVRRRGSGRRAAVARPRRLEFRVRSRGRGSRATGCELERRAVRVTVGKTQPSLLLVRQKRRWDDGAAVVVPHGHRASPDAIRHGEVRADSPRRVSRRRWRDRDIARRNAGVDAGRELRLGRGGHGLEDSRPDTTRGGPRRTGAERPRIAPKRKNPGDDLFSRKAALSVSSALESLTSVFGMGTGVASPLESPGVSAWIAFGSGPFAHASCPRAGRQLVEIVDLTSWLERSRLQPPTPGQLPKRASPRPLVPLSFIRHRTTTCGLSNRWSPCGLTRLTRWGTSSRGELRT